ncbi:protein root UVB sensitive 4 [Fagus crenata]
MRLQLVRVDGGASSFSFNFDDGFRKMLGCLPVVMRLQLVRVDGGASSFSFDFDDGFRKMLGRLLVVMRLQLVRVDGGASSFSFDFDDGFRKMFRLCGLAFRDFFIPKQVSGNYMDYVKWKFLHRVFSSAL